MVAEVWNLSTQETERCWLELHSKFKAKLDYIVILCLEKPNKILQLK